MTRCEFCSCIYNNKNICTLKQIEIDSMGHCMECIIINIPYDIQELYRDKQLRDLSKR